MRSYFFLLLCFTIMTQTGFGQTRYYSYSLPYDTAKGGFSVNADWTQTVEPDVASILLTVDAQRSDLRSTEDQNKAILEKIQTALKDQSCNLYMEPQHTISIPQSNSYSGYSTSLPEPDYIVSRTLQIVTYRVSQYPEIMKILSQINGLTVNRVDFSSSKMDSLNADALKNAQNYIQKKADEASRVLGIKLGKMYQFSCAEPTFNQEFNSGSYPVTSPSQIQPMNNMLPRIGKLTFKTAISGTFEIKP